MGGMQFLREGGYRRLPVTRDGVLVGIVTDRDLKEATPSRATTLSIYELNYLLSKLKVKDVMRTPVITVRSDDTIEQAALLMEEHRVSGLPVLDGSDLVGILTITDLMRALVSFLALREGGRRITVDLPDEPGVLARVAQAGPPSNIVAAVTTGIQPGHKRRLVLRATGEGADAYADRLRAAGVEAVDERRGGRRRARGARGRALTAGRRARGTRLRGVALLLRAGGGGRQRAGGRRAGGEGRQRRAGAGGRGDRPRQLRAGQRRRRDAPRQPQGDAGGEAGRPLRGRARRGLPATRRVRAALALPMAAGGVPALRS